MNSVIRWMSSTFGVDGATDEFERDMNASPLDGSAQRAYLERMVELIFEAPKGQRMHRYFWCATIMDGQEPDLWWVDELNRFLPHGAPELAMYSHGSDSRTIRTVKAFRRFLRKHPELKGRKVRLVNRYIGHDVFGAL